jgi:hypothetical protein
MAELVNDDLLVDPDRHFFVIRNKDRTYFISHETGQVLELVIILVDDEVLSQAVKGIARHLAREGGIDQEWMKKTEPFKEIRLDFPTQLMPPELPFPNIQYNPIKDKG